MKFYNKAKVKKVYVISEEEALNLWSYYYNKAEKEEEDGFKYLAEITRKDARKLHDILKASGAIDRLYERAKNY